MIPCSVPSAATNGLGSFGECDCWAFFLFLRSIGAGSSEAMRAAVRRGATHAARLGVTSDSVSGSAREMDLPSTSCSRHAVNTSRTFYVLCPLVIYFCETPRHKSDVITETHLQ